ncbi:AzlD domain-containing protein [Microlunatus flavus]|uniref:Branched-chain amino acid transport protein (AzlD) n=1 Tax=Microlunatus flavus TaxID=1036181 RepID=A0A1H9FC86_9ACTN|nr:AzlD domain-containing protein [Microlunatus flavus]SEQ35043.1 Branched-chain amino acid transport protein (AzlD) [Microlunatus flavus]
MNLWVPVLIACAGSYLIKLAGLSLPESVLANPGVQRVTTLLPVAMLAALVAVQLVQSGDGAGPYALDWRVLVGVAAGAVALLLRRGFLVVFVVAVVVTALLRLLVPAG